MQLRTVITEGMHAAVVEAFRSEEFATTILRAVVHDCLQASDPIGRPAEYSMLQPETAIRVQGQLGVSVSLSGVTRGVRPTKLFHNALSVLNGLVSRTVITALKDTDSELRVWVFCLLELDEAVEIAAGKGIHSRLVERQATLVSAKGVVAGPA